MDAIFEEGIHWTAYLKDVQEIIYFHTFRNLFQLIEFIKYFAALVAMLTSEIIMLCKIVIHTNVGNIIYYFI